MKLVLLALFGFTLPLFATSKSHYRWSFTLTGPFPAVGVLDLPNDTQVTALTNNGQLNSGRTKVVWLATTPGTLSVELTTPIPFSGTPSLALTPDGAVTRTLVGITEDLPLPAAALLPSATDLLTDTDRDGIPNLIEAMLGLPADAPSDLSRRFSVQATGENRTITLPFASQPNFDLLIRPAPIPGSPLPTAFRASQHLNTTGNLVSIPNLPDPFLFTLQVIPIR